MASCCTITYHRETHTTHRWNPPYRIEPPFNFCPNSWLINGFVTRVRRRVCMWSRNSLPFFSCKTRDLFRCSGKVSSSYSTFDTRRVTVKRHEHHLIWKSCWVVSFTWVIPRWLWCYSLFLNITLHISKILMQTILSSFWKLNSRFCSQSCTLNTIILGSFQKVLYLHFINCTYR
jgi:hypothetical protein